MVLKDYIRDFYKYQRDTGAYGDIDKELNEYIYSVQEETGKKAKKLINQMKSYLIKHKKWNSEKQIWH